MSPRSRLRSLALAILLGGAVGAFSALYLRAVGLLEQVLWDGHEPRLPGDARVGTVLLCAAGGLLVGLLRVRHDRDTPHDLEDALLALDDVVATDDETPAPPPKVAWLVRAALLGIVSLGFGASLGPEAPLLVLATGFGQRTARILRSTQREAAYVSAAGALSGLFGGPLGSVALPVERSRRSDRATSLVGLGIVAAVAGLVALLLVLPGEGGHQYVLPDAGVATGRDLVITLGWGALAAVPATFVGLALLLLTLPARRTAERWVASPVLRGVAGGVVLGACGALAPLALFSGQHEGQQLLDEAAERTAWGLLALVALKLVATLACLTTGWFGGQIFPAVFAGMAAALTVVALFPSAPVGPVAAAGAGAAATAVLRRPLASVLMMLFFFPPTAVLALTLGAGVATLAVQLLGDRAPEPAPLSPGGH